METWPLGQPVVDQRRLVRSIIVHDEVDVQVGRRLGLDGVQELAELHRSVASLAAADHLAGLGVQCGKQRHRAVAQIIVGAPFRLSGTHGQQRAGTVQSLDLGLFVHAQHQRSVRRIQVKAHDVAHLLDEEWI